MKYISRSIDVGKTNAMTISQGRDDVNLYLIKENNVVVAMDILGEAENRLDCPAADQMGVIATTSLLRGVEPLVVAGSRDGTLQMWQQTKNTHFKVARPRKGAILCLQSFLDRRFKCILLIGYNDGVVLLWDLTADTIIMQKQEHFGWVNCVTMGSQGDRIIAVSGGSDGVAILWDMYSNKSIHKLQHDRGVQSVAVACRDISPVIATGCVDAVIRIWDEETGVLLRILDRHYDSVLALSFWEGNEILLISGSADTSIRVWDILSGECVVTLLAHNDFVTQVVVSRVPLPCVFSCSSDSTVRIWDLATIVEDYYRASFFCVMYGIGKRNDRPAYDVAVPSTSALKHSSFVDDMVRGNKIYARLSGQLPLQMKKGELNPAEYRPEETSSSINASVPRPAEPASSNKTAAHPKPAPAAVVPIMNNAVVPVVAAPKVAEKKGRVSPETRSATVSNPSSTAKTLSAPKQSVHTKEMQEKMELAAINKKLAQAAAEAEIASVHGKTKSNQILNTKLTTRGVEHTVPARVASTTSSEMLKKAIIDESEVQDERRKQSILRVKEQAAEKLKQRLGEKASTQKGKAQTSGSAAVTSNKNSSIKTRKIESSSSEEESDGSYEDDSDGSYEEGSSEEDSEED